MRQLKIYLAVAPFFLWQTLACSATALNNRLSSSPDSPAITPEIRRAVLQELAEKIKERASTNHVLLGQTIFSLGDSCHGVMLSCGDSFGGLTGAHCLRTCQGRAGQTVGGEIRFPVYFDGSTEQIADCDGQYTGVDGGFGFIRNMPFDLAFEKEKVLTIDPDPQIDLAYIGNLFPNGLPPELAALEVAESDPLPGELVFSLHWEPHNWLVETAQGPVKKEGELLKHELGMFLGPQPGSRLNSYLFDIYGGDSGTPIVNNKGKLVGIMVTGCDDEDAHLKMCMSAVSVQTIRSLLQVICYNNP